MSAVRVILSAQSLWAAGVIAVCFLSPLTGCRSWETPQWDNPGPADVQRQAAERYDPYPETDVGQEIVGSRPPGYEYPLSEPERIRRKPWLPELW
ncbi:MAG: membrane or secreted protein [Thermogutta sp.]|nr:membrane or secreted protein [Thermogutta sp.]